MLLGMKSVIAEHIEMFFGDNDAGYEAFRFSQGREPILHGPGGRCEKHVEKEPVFPEKHSQFFGNRENNVSVFAIDAFRGYGIRSVLSVCDAAGVAEP
jgi:hypothetical protein